MRNIKIVADSSANLQELSKIPFAAAPIKVITAEREFMDDPALDVEGMVDFFESYKGRSQTYCPNPADWQRARCGSLIAAMSRRLPSSKP